MNKIVYVTLFLSLILVYQPIISQEYPKVILRGDYPDPTVLRDGDDYYMTHSPFIYSPGFLIWHSNDLLHWEPICRALTEHTGSAMAPDLVKYNDKYYIYYPATGSNWVIWADQIQGPWSKPIDLKTPFIDPGHSLGEDGKRYLHTSDGHVVQLADDGLSVVNSPKIIYAGWDIPNNWVTECKCLESPKITKRGAYFYMTTAEGGTAGPPTSHMVISARSKSILGPWENSPYNPIVHTFSVDDKWWSKGHGTLVDDVNGNWWIIYHAYENGYHSLGRQTLLEPIQWTEEGWFRTANRATPIEVQKKPKSHGMVLSDDFDGKQLGLQWTMWRHFDAEAVTLTNKKLQLAGKGASPKDARILLTTATDKSYETEVLVTLNKGGIGGLLLFYNEKAFVGMSSDGKVLTIYEGADRLTQIPHRYGKQFFLKIVNTRNVCDFQISKDNIRWDTVRSNLSVSEMNHNRFKGFFALRVGLMSAGTGLVLFDDFTYQPQKGYLFAYFTDKANNHNGLHFAWSKNGYHWLGIGPEHSFLKSDYGQGGTEKKMRDPFVMQGPDGMWHCLWTINWNSNLIGHASSKDLIHWNRQSYVPVMDGFEAKNCWAPEMIYDDTEKQYVIFWSSTIKVDGNWKVEPGFKYDNRLYYTVTKDFKSFAPAKLLFDPGHNVIDATIQKQGDTYQMVYKDERELPIPHKNLLVATSSNATGPFAPTGVPTFTKDWVEGPAVCRLSDNSYLVYMDAYKDKKYEAKRTTDFKSWEDVSDRISLPVGTKHGSIVETTLDHMDELVFEQKDMERQGREKASKDGVLAPKPVFRDPIYDGAADPIVIWNPLVSKWWMYYTNRRANRTDLPGVSWVHGTPIGIAESVDGANWKYFGTAEFPDLPAESGGKDATLWAPDIVQGDDGKWHMFLSIVPGISNKWGLPGFISHLTSTDMRVWKYESQLSQLGVRVIDSDILRMQDGTWRMYYKDQRNYSHIDVTESKDLYTWSEPKEALKVRGEGPIAFLWKGYYWLIIDTWNGQTVHRSKEGETWEVQPESPLLRDDEGIGLDDIPNALHANVVVSNDRVYLYYFTHPGRIGADKQKDGFEQRRTSIQVVELEITKEGWLRADRNKPTYVQLFPPTPIKATMKIDVGNSKKISKNLFGIFFEDLNYAADGGLYAELVQNRSFEYQISDVQGRDTIWNALKSWKLYASETGKGSLRIDTMAPLNSFNIHYAVLSGKGASLINDGFDGITLNEGDLYDFSVFAMTLSNDKVKLQVRLIGSKGEIYGETQTGLLSNDWKKHAVTIRSKTTTSNARLMVMVSSKAEVALDMISLFPQKTFKNRTNGLRLDLAQTIADLKPAFMRFPGGCLTHGDGVENLYDWKKTVGPLEQREGQRNIWNYHQSVGLGYFEYFQFCEDIGAMPLPVLAAGVCCQNSKGGQNGVPLCEMDHYVQDVLDLIEYSNGDSSTTWGKVRAAAGHPEPFNLKYLGIGNEDLISDAFEERFTLIFNKVKERYPEVTVIGTTGPFNKGTDYEEGWALADRLKVPMVDEHYYQSPGWFINNQRFYDAYPRSGSKVYLGEYASQNNTLYNALAEAAYMTFLERNGDVVQMASYAPLLANEKHTQWRPDLIFFSNEEVKLTPNYYVQQLFSCNAGDTYLPSTIKLVGSTEPMEKRVVSSVVMDLKTGDIIVKLVNLLPTKVKMEIGLDGVRPIVPLADYILLTGAPEARSVKKPSTTKISVSKVFDCELPASSVVVIRVKSKK